MDTKKLRQKVLDLAIRGKLVPQDPNDEPASVLLERIYAEKQKLISEGKIKREKRSSFIFKGEDNSYYEKVVENGKETIRDITAEIPFDIPETWAWTRLGSVINLYNGYAFKSSEYADDGIPIVRIGDLVDGYVNLDACVKVKQSTLYRRFEIPYGSLLLAMSGATTGKIAINKHSGIIYLNQRVGRIESIEVEEEYIVIFFNNIVSKNLKKAYGCAIPNLSSTQVNETLIPLPPLFEQRRIISIIRKLVNQVSNIDNAYDTLSAKIAQTKSKLLDLAIRGKLLPQNPNDKPASALLERIREEQESTKTKRKSIGSYIFKGGDNLYYEKIGNETICIQEEIPFDIPENWIWCRLGNVCALKDGDYIYEQNLPYLEVKYLRGKIEATISDKGKFVKAGQMLILVDGENSGEIFYVPEDGYQGSTFKILTTINMENKEYIHLFITKNKELFKASKKGSAIPHLNKKMFQELLLPLPPFAEQKRIVDFITRANEQLDSMLNK